MALLNEEKRAVPASLRKRAEARGTTPVALLEEVLSESATYEEAAAKLFVTQRTLLNWRRQLLGGQDE